MDINVKKEIYNMEQEKLILLRGYGNTWPL